MQENSEKQFSKLTNKINEHQNNFTKEIKTIKKEPNRKSGAEELMRCGMHYKSTGNRANQIEERIIKLKDRNLEKTQEEGEFFKMKELYENYLTSLERGT